MRKMALRGAFLIMALGGLVALPLAFASGEKNGERQDCPGKVTCPLTGEEVCKDRCPLAAKAAASTASVSVREDCPGKVACPLTGEEICKDQCPVTASATAVSASSADASDDLPACCRKAKE